MESHHQHYACIKHKESQVEFYKPKENLLLCKVCLQEEQQDQKKGEVLKIDHEKLKELQKVAVENLSSIKNAIEESIEQVKSEDQSTQGLNNLINLCQAFMRLQGQGDNEEVKSKLSTSFQDVFESHHQKSLEIKPSARQMDSVLVKTQEQEDLICQWLGFMPKFKLLMRGSKNGFKASKFHFLCDKKGPIMIIAKSEFGYIFGGYTSKNQKTTGDIEMEQDPQAFIFSLKHLTKHEPINKDGRLVGHHPMRMGVFGRSEERKEDSDLEIVDECNIARYSWTNLGNSFKLPDAIKFESKDANIYLAGGKEFKIVELEVFQVKVSK